MALSREGSGAVEELGYIEGVACVSSAVNADICSSGGVFGLRIIAICQGFEVVLLVEWSSFFLFPQAGKCQHDSPHIQSEGQEDNRTITLIHSFSC